MRTFATPGPILATVVVAGAQVRVTASDRTDTVVLVEPVNPGDPAHVKVAARTKVDFAGGRLSVKTTTSGESGGSVVITVDLPTGSSLVSYLSHSDVHADGAYGECELHMSSGEVHLDRISTLRATIAGGQVWIGHATADLDLSSANASFDIDRADANVTAKTGTGAIRIGRLTRGHAELANHAGDIEIGIAAGSAATVDADSKKGTVRTTLPTRQHPDVTVHARSRHGDIIVQSAASVASTS